jgi:hypothetical protein
MFSFFYLIIVFQLATMVVIYSRFTTLILSVEINTTAWKKKKKKRGVILVKTKTRMQSQTVFMTLSLQKLRR